MRSIYMRNTESARSVNQSIPCSSLLAAAANWSWRERFSERRLMRTVVITTSAGRDELTRRGAATLGSVEIHALDSSGGSITPQAILQLLQSQFGVKTLLHEGGPTLFGQFLAAEAVDELFLTLSPQIAGRKGDATRPAILQGVAFMPDSAPWFQMVSAKEKAAYLYLRYRRQRS